MSENHNAQLQLGPSSSSIRDGGGWNGPIQKPTAYALTHSRTASVFAIFVLVVLILPFTVISYVAFLLLFYSVIRERLSVLRIGFVFVVAAQVVLWSSRKIGVSSSDDLLPYFENYLACSNSWDTCEFAFARGFEPVLPILHFLLPRGLSEHALLLIYLIIAGLLVLYIAEKTIFEARSSYITSAILVGFFISMPVIQNGTQVVRAFIAALVMLAAMRNRSAKMFLVAALTHGSSLIVYATNVLVRKRFVGISFVILLALTFALLTFANEIALFVAASDYTGRIGYSLTDDRTPNVMRWTLSFVAFTYSLFLFIGTKDVTYLILWIVVTAIEFVLLDFKLLYFRLFPHYSMMLPVFYFFYTHYRPKADLGKSAVRHQGLAFLSILLSVVVWANAIVSAVSSNDNDFAPLDKFGIFSPAISVFF